MEVHIVDNTSPLVLVLRLCIAAILGSLVGMERERLEWAPGLRTHMLICLGACLFMINSSHGFMDFLAQPHAELDVSRVAAQIASGVGFLGAGTIFFRKDALKGLTTAASIWAVAAMGMAVGGGLYLLAVVTTVLMLIILAGIKPLEKRVFKHYKNRALRIVIGPETTLMDIRSIVNNHRVNLQEVSLHETDDKTRDEVEIILRKISPKKLLPLIEELRNFDGVHGVRYSRD